MKERRLAVFSAILVLVISGCAHLPAGKGEAPEALFADACRPGKANHAVKGSIWMKIDSKDAKGQFPATVEATVPDHVILEVTNLLGSREALIQVNRGSYTVDVPRNSRGEARRAQGRESWGGIPLHWASELFLGQIPCPTEAQAKAFHLQVTDSGDLIAENRSEKFIYHFRKWAGRAWPESLHWENAKTAVDFKFDDPEDKTGSPKKWEAKSHRGEVKVRWRDIQISS